MEPAGIRGCPFDRFAGFRTCLIVRDSQAAERGSYVDEAIKKRIFFIINVLYWTIAAALAWLAVKYLIPWLLPFILGYAIAQMVKPVVDRMVRRLRMNQKLAGFLVMVLAYGLIVLLLVLAGIRLAPLLMKAFLNLPDFFIETVKPGLQSLGDWINSLPVQFAPELTSEADQLFGTILQSVQDALISLSRSALSFLAGVTGKIPSFLLAFLFTIMSSLLISMNSRDVNGFIIRQIPQRYKRFLLELRKCLSNTILRYFRAYLILMFITFVELSIGLTVLGVKNSVGIAALIALFDLLPVFGTGGIMIPWVLIRLIGGDVPLALGLAIVYGIVTLVRNIIEPKIVGDQLGLNPLVTLIAIYIGFKTMGVVGMILLPILLQILISLRDSGILKLWK